MLLVTTKRDKVIDMGHVVTIGLCQLAIVPYKACNTAAVAVDRLIELIQPC